MSPNKRIEDVAKPDHPIDWTQLYKDVPVEQLPWFNPELDQDLAQELKTRQIKNGKFLDLGTGPGTQAIALADRGFAVWGTDLSKPAIEGARQRDAKKMVHFAHDDILKTKIRETFDYILDRGCFHVLEPAEHAAYLQNVGKILKRDGLLFIKTFSTAEPRERGPKRYSSNSLASIFSPTFKMLDWRDSVFSTAANNPEIDHAPKALFAVMQKKE